jgi:predicted amidohydrolase
MKHRIRVASCQYFIRPVTTFDEFRDQVAGLVETAAGYDCQLLVFPEYFTIQLLTLGDLSRPLREQVRAVAKYLPRYVDLLGTLARKRQMYIVGGTIPVLGDDGETLYNDSYVFGPGGDHGVQGKLHVTQWEKEDWRVEPREKMRLFETRFGRLAVAICYDVEFPEMARAAAREGANLLAVPSCTDDRQAFLRVRYCAQARAIENQMYVIHSPTVGSLPMIPGVSLNYGQASILTPSDFPFARDGVLAEGNVNQEMLVIAELNLDTIEESRSFGTVLPLNDSHRSAELCRDPEVLTL